MKSFITPLPCALALGLVLPLGAAEKKTEPKLDAARKSSTRSVVVSSSSLVTNGGPASGAVVVTTDVDGQRETKTFNLGASGGGAARWSNPAARPPAGPVTYLGVAAGEVRDDLAAHLPLDRGAGLVALSVAPDSPAAAAGLVENDVLVKFDDQVLIHPQQLQVLVRHRAEGDKVKLTYLRKGQPKTATVTLTKREPSLEEVQREFRSGNTLRLTPPVDDLIRQFQSGSPAAFHRQTVVVGPDGKVQTWTGDVPDRKKIADQVIEGLQKAGVSADVQKQVRQSIEGKAAGEKF